MSLGKVNKTLKWLHENGHIEQKKDDKYGRIGWSVVLPREQNVILDEQTQQNSVSPGERRVLPGERSVSPHEHVVSPGERHLNKTNIKRLNNKTKEENIYIHPLPDEIQNLVTAISQTVKTAYGPKTEDDFESAAYTLFGWDVEPGKVCDFGAWWEANGYYKGKPALKSMTDEFRNYLDGVTMSRNGHKGETAKKPNHKTTAADSYREVFGE